MTRKRTPQREQFLRDVLTTAVEGGIQYWAEVTAYDPEAGTATVIAQDYDDEPTEREVDIDVISRGISRARRLGLSSMSGQDYVGMFWLAYKTCGEDGDYDADIADSILQLGLFAEVVYA